MTISATETFLQHELAKVAHLLNNDDEAFEAYQTALSPTITTVNDVLESGHELDLESINTSVIEDFSRFCQSKGIGSNLSKLREQLTTYTSSADLPVDQSLKIGILCLRLLDRNTSSDVRTSEFSKIITLAEKKYETVSDEIQKIYLDYIKLLLDLNEFNLAKSVIMDRLDTLDPGFSSSLIATAVTNETSLAERVKNRLVRDQASMEKLTALYTEGNTAYNAGDHEKAFELHMEAASQNYDQSQFSIGTFYQLGIGCDINMVQARKFYHLASEQGLAVAQHHYAALLQMGLGGSADVPESMRWYKAAAKQNHVPAYMNIAAIYGTNLMPEGQRIALTIAYFLRAHELGNPSALDNALAYFELPVTMYN